MDAELAALAATGAQTIVTLMATDAWNRTKGLVSRIFTTDRSPDDEVIRDLEQAQTQIATTSVEQSARVREQQVDRWESRLRLRLIDDPQVASVIIEVIDAAAAEGATPASSSRDITIHGFASGHGKVYQQGHGVQHND